MMQKNVLVVAAGAALGLSSFAHAQSTADQSRAYANELASDASGRESFAADSTVEVFGQIQFRYVINSRDNVAGSDDDAAVGFQTRRTKLGVKGTVGESFGYEVRGAFDRDESGSFNLENAFVTYSVDDSWTAKWGQFKLATLREEFVSSSKQLAVERSTVNETFNQDYSQGIEFQFQNDSFMFRGAFSDGLGTRNTDFTSTVEADYAFTGRLDYRWGAGDWKRYDDFTSWRGSEFGGIVGGGAHWQSGGDTVGTVDTDGWQIFADVGVEGNGWNAFGAVVWQSASPAGGSDRDDLGWLIQAGWFMNDNWELFGRFDMVMPDDDDALGSSNDEFGTITIGVNDYIIPESHAAKFTADVVWHLDPLDQSSDVVSENTGTGLLSDSEGDQVVLRLQFQLLF